MDSANVNIGSIQRILGHERRSTTEIYLHSIGASERAAMEVFEAETNGEVQKVTHPSDTPGGEDQQVEG